MLKMVLQDGACEGTWEAVHTRWDWEAGPPGYLRVSGLNGTVSSLGDSWNHIFRRFEGDLPAL
jgi:hypothetical protein